MSRVVQVQLEPKLAQQVVCRAAYSMYWPILPATNCDRSRRQYWPIHCIGSENTVIDAVRTAFEFPSLFPRPPRPASCTTGAALNSITVMKEGRGVRQMSHLSDFSSFFLFAPCRLFQICSYYSCSLLGCGETEPTSSRDANH